MALRVCGDEQLQELEQRLEGFIYRDQVRKCGKEECQCEDKTHRKRSTKRDNKKKNKNIVIAIIKIRNIAIVTLIKEDKKNNKNKRNIDLN